MMVVARISIKVLFQMMAVKHWNRDLGKAGIQTNAANSEIILSKGLGIPTLRGEIKTNKCNYLA